MAVMLVTLRAGDASYAVAQVILYVAHASAVGMFTLSLRRIFVLCGLLFYNNACLNCNA